MEALAIRLNDFLGLHITARWLWKTENRKLIMTVLKEIIEYGDSDSRAEKATELYREMR